MEYATTIGLRYIRSTKKRSISAIGLVAIVGVALGVAALSAVLCISTGFQEEFTRKVLGVNAHVLVMKYGMNFGEYRDVERRIRRLSGVVATEPFIIQEMMISHGSKVAGVLLKGVDPDKVGDVLDLPSYMQKGTLAGLREPPIPRSGTAVVRTQQATEGLSDTGDTATRNGDPPPAAAPPPRPAASQPGIVLGKNLAENLGVSVGDTVRVTTPLIGVDLLGWSPGTDAPTHIDFRVAGIFYAGFLEYDTKLALVHLRQAQRFFDQGDTVTGIEIRVRDVHRATAVGKNIETVLTSDLFRVVSWEELNRPLFTALKTQKLAFAVLLSIIVGVAAFNIIATLVMMVFDKRREIAILKSMGASRTAIMRIFVVAGAVVGSWGIAIGLLLGYGACWLLDTVGWPLDPEVYLIDRLPVAIEPLTFVAAAVTAFVICLCAAAIPSLTAARLRPVDGLRQQ